MRFEHTLRYDAPPQAVFAMLGEAVFRERVCEAQHTTEATATVDGSDGTMSVTVDQRRPTDGTPSLAGRFVGDSIHIRQHEEWRSPTDATLEVSVPGKPAHLKGTITLRHDGEGTVETVSGDIRVHVPLIGGRLEGFIAQLLGHALRAEQRVGKDWLARE